MRPPSANQDRFAKGPAFSLVEMLVSIVIIGVLSTVVAGGLRVYSENVKRIQCASQLRQIYTAISLYRSEYNNTFPAANPWNSDTGDAGWLAWYTGNSKYGKESPLAGYVGGLDTLRRLSVCPVNTQNEAGPIPENTHNTYGYPYTVNYNLMVDSLSGGKMPKNASLVTRPANTVLMADSEPSVWGLGFGDTGWANFQRIGKRHNQKSNILWCDGHVTTQALDAITNSNLYP